MNQVVILARLKDEMLQQYQETAEVLARQAVSAKVSQRELANAASFAREAGNLAEIVMFAKRRVSRHPAWLRFVHGTVNIVEVLEGMREALLAHSELDLAQRKYVMSEFLCLIQNYSSFLQ